MRRELSYKAIQECRQPEHMNEKPVYDFRLLSAFGVFNWTAMGVLLLLLGLRLMRDFTLAGPDSVDITFDLIFTGFWLLALFSILRCRIAFYDSRIEITSGPGLTRRYSYGQLNDVQSVGANFADALVLIFDDKKKSSLSRKMRGDVAPATLVTFINARCGRELLTVS
jgi:hypothetical protein